MRGPWLTSYFGSILLVGIPVMFVTGLISYASYDPRLAGNDTTPGKGILGFYLFSWVTNPSWVYRVSQGTHVILGLTLVPILLAKLWSVIPKLFEWPGMRSVAHFLERLSLMLVVGGASFGIRDWDRRHRVLLPLEVRLLRGAPLRRVGLHRRLRGAHLPKTADNVAVSPALQPARHIQDPA